jgi:hypothetical protein
LGAVEKNGLFLFVALGALILCGWAILNLVRIAKGRDSREFGYPQRLPWWSWAIWLFFGLCYLAGVLPGLLFGDPMLLVNHVFAAIHSR